MILRLVFLAFLMQLVSCGPNSKRYQKKYCVEKENADCMCTMEYDPVCGCNGKTYSNQCQAECYGILKYTPGECK